MTAPMPPCKFCEKEGLPIVPMRLGIAPTKSFDVYKFQTTPPDPTQLLGMPEVALDAPDTMYTGRLLRAGYLYVYYQTHNQWEAYAVDHEGCLSRVSLTNDNPPGGDRFHAACARDAAKVANASVLTIEDPETAGTVWIGFSDAWWTKAIRDKNADLSDIERGKFMRKVDVGSWFNGGNPGGSMPEHAFQVYQVDMLMAEYAMSITDGALAFAWATPAGFDPFTARPADTLKQACDALAPAKGLVLELPDPVGLTMELANYMERRWHTFSEPYGHRMAVDSDLKQLEQVVRRQAQDQLVSHVDFKQNAVQSLGDLALTEMADGIRHIFGKDQIPVPDNLAPASVQGYSDAVWRQYADVIDQGKRQAFQQSYKSAADTFNQHMMRPLAKAHASWMQSATTRAVFEHHYDPEDINTGVAFTSVFTACVSGTAGYGACLKCYHDWLEEGLQDSMSSTNLLWRALIYNQPTLAAKLKAVGAASKKSGGDPSQPWTALFASFEAVAGKLRFAGESHAKALRLQGGDVRALMMELGAPLADVVQSRGAAGADALAMLGMHAGSPARVVTAYGTPSDFYRAIFDNLDSLQPAVGKDAPTARMFSLYDRMRIIRAEMEAAGIDIHSETLRTWTVLLDASPSEPSLQGQSVEVQAGAAAARVKAAAAVPDERIIPVEDVATRTMRGLKGPGAIAIISTILAAVSWNSAAQAVHGAMAGRKTEAEAMLWSARAGVVSSGFYLAQAAIEAGAARPSSLLGPIGRLVSTRQLAFVKGFGAGAGAVAMLVAMTLDAFSGVQTTSSGEAGVATLYFMRGFGELSLGIQAGLDLLAIVTSGVFEVVLISGPAVWVVLAAIAAVSIVISLVEDPATLTWAKECTFGESPEEDYKDNPGLEHKDFQKAMAAS